MEQLVAASTAERRFTIVVLAVFAAVALILAAIGIYGLINYFVSRRVREIGLHMALGARTNQIVGLVVREALATTAAGAVLGIGASLLLVRFLASLLYGVKPLDWPAYLVACVTLAVAVLCAACRPAYRAARIDPAVAIRHE